MDLLFPNQKYFKANFDLRTSEGFFLISQELSIHSAPLVLVIRPWRMLTDVGEKGCDTQARRGLVEQNSAAHFCTFGTGVIFLQSPKSCLGTFCAAFGSEKAR
jgi:hypothetical protein